MSGGGESLHAYVHPELVDCAKAVSKFHCLRIVVFFYPSNKVVFVSLCIMLVCLSVCQQCYWRKFRINYCEIFERIGMTNSGLDFEDDMFELLGSVSCG